MIKRGDLIYSHTLDEMDLELGVCRGVYEVIHSTENTIRVFVNNTNNSHFLYKNQVYKVVSNKINKLLYKGLK